MFIKQLPYALAILGAMAALYLPQAVAGTPPVDVNVAASFNYQALITDGSGNPITNATNLTFEFKIYDPSAQCLLYDEVQSPKSSDGTGLVSLNVGSLLTGPTALKRTSADPGFTMSYIIANNPMTTYPVSAFCSSPYTPTVGDVRLLRVIVTEPAGPPITLSPDVALGSVPQAYVADTLQGLGPTNFVQVEGNVTQTNMDTLTAGSGSDASALHNHDSRYVLKGAPNTGSNSNIDTTGTVGIGTTSANDGANLDVEGTAPTVIIGGSGSSGNALTLNFDSNSGGQNRASIQSMDNNNTLSFWTGGLQAMDINSSQQVTFSQQATFLSSVSTAGSLGVSGTVSVGQYTSTQEGVLISGLSSANQGTIWQNSTLDALRYWNGSAALTVANTSNTVSSVAVTAPITNSGSPLAPNISITQASTAQGGYLSSTDWNTFNGKVSKTGDTMTGTLNLPTNGLVAGTSQLVLNGGNVGVGTTVPSALLHVLAPTSSTIGSIIQGSAGQANDLTDWENNAGTVLSYIDSGGKFHGDGSNLVNLPSGPWNTSGPNIYNNNSGNVGIGTTNPVGILDVEGGGAAVFNNAGGVGIGTTNPTATLEVVSATANGILVAGSSSYGVNAQGTTAGVYGASLTQYGVWGSASSGRGVLGSSSSGYAIYGTSATGTSGYFQTSGASNTNPTLVIQEGATQTGDLMDWDNLSGTPLMNVDNGGNLNMNGNFIHNLANPSVNTDAVNKQYVTTYVGSAGYLPLAGGIMTGNLTTPSISTGTLNTTNTVSILPGANPALNITPSTAGNTVAVGASQFVITNSGKVGIGTTAPVGILDVEAGGGPVILNSSSVGVGTNFPSFPLDVQNSAALTTMHVTNNNGAGGAVGIAVATSGSGDEGLSVSPSGSNSIGVYVTASGATSTGVYSQGSQYGVEGLSNTAASSAVFGFNTGAAISGNGVKGSSDNGTGVYGESINGVSAQFETNGTNNANPTLQVVAGTSQTGPLIALNNEGPGSNAALLNALGNVTTTIINSSGFLGVGVASATAELELGGSTGIVPSLVVDSGTLVTTPKAGAIEFDGSDFYVTDSNQYRRSIAGVYVEKTAGTYNGATIGGYSAANTFCNGTVSGSHMCMADEMVRSVTLGISMPNGAWYSTGIAVSGSTSADCDGWQQTGTLNAMVWDNAAGAGEVESCTTPYAIACCK